MTRVTRGTLLRRIACGLALAATMGCKGPVDPAQNVTETFTGTLQPGVVSTTAFFSVLRAGEFSVTLLDLTPPASIFLTTAMGLVTSNLCSAIGQVNTASARGQVVLTGQMNAGIYCVIVADQGNISVPTVYRLSVS